MVDTFGESDLDSHQPSTFQLSTNLGAIAKWVFGIPPRETSFETRRFRGGAGGARERIERIGSTFVEGYNSALLDHRRDQLVPKLDQIDADFRGFAYEGAAMGLALLDRLTPWRSHRVRDFLSGAGAPHAYMVHVAIGWVAARWPGKISKVMEPLDPLLRWLVLDGYGFHEGFFHWPQSVVGHLVPERLEGYERRAFDQGLGRSLWFVDGADVSLLLQTLGAFPALRHGDLWSGIGLACVYAGEISDHELKSLREGAGGFLPQLAQGAAFAAKARHRAGNLTPYHDRACAALCGMSAVQAALVTDAALENLPGTQLEPAFEIWRRRIQDKFAQGKELKR